MAEKYVSIRYGAYLSTFIQNFKSMQKFVIASFSLTKLMVSHDYLPSTVANQIAFDQQDLNLAFIFERVIDRCCQAVVSKLETLEPITFI